MAPGRGFSELPRRGQTLGIIKLRLHPHTRSTRCKTKLLRSSCKGPKPWTYNIKCGFPLQPCPRGRSYICTYMCMHISLCIYYVCIHIYIYIYIYTHIYIYIYIRTAVEGPDRASSHRPLVAEHARRSWGSLRWRTFVIVTAIAVTTAIAIAITIAIAIAIAIASLVLLLLLLLLLLLYNAGWGNLILQAGSCMCFGKVVCDGLAENWGDCQLSTVKSPNSIAEICGDDESTRRQCGNMSKSWLVKFPVLWKTHTLCFQVWDLRPSMWKCAFWNRELWPHPSFARLLLSQKCTGKGTWRQGTSVET